MPYIGKTPSQATRRRYYKTASGSETSLSGTMTSGGTLTFTDGEFVDVSVNGVALVAGTDYNTTTANTIGGLSALSANDQVEIIVYDTFSVFGGNVNADFTINNGTFTAGTVDINGGAIDGVTIGTNSAVTDMRVDNIKIDGNTLSSTDTNGDITLDPNGTGDVIIASGNVGIGEASPSRNLVIKDTDGQVDIGLVSSNTGVSALMFADTDDSNIGRIQYLHSTNDLTFTTNDSEAMRINSSGLVGINTTAPSGANLEIFTGSTASDGLKINRFGSGVYYSTLRQDSHGLAFHVGNGSAIAERAAITPNGITFGGDTAAANALDDYEEGTWTATLTGSTSNPSSTVQTTSARYTKVGRLVFVQGQFSNVDTTGASGAPRVTGLPYGAATSYATGNVMTYNRFTLGTTASNVSPYVAGSTIFFYQSTNQAGWAEIAHSAGSAAYLAFTATYET